MATTYTTNYNLGKQTDHADKFDMSVITDNADKIDTALKENADAISSKVDKETGKGLSTNDFTTAEKTKLDDIAEIKSIGTGLNLDDNGELTATGGGSGGTTNYNDLSNKPQINGNTLSGDKTSAQLGLASASDIPTVPITAIQKNGTGITPVSGTVNITVPTTAADVSALPDTTKYAAALSLTINSSTYVMTGQLKDQNGDNLGTAQTIDLPLESVVVGGSYNSQTKKVVLTLQNGNTIEFSVADLVSGLQTELSASNKLNPAYINYDSTHRAVSDTEKSTWNGKQNALSSAQLDAVNSGITAAKVTAFEAKQDAITSNNKLSADLVDDAATANKFVTAADKTAWNAKQNAIDSLHMLDADLVDDTTATHKFATAAQLSQIETNKNNISTDEAALVELVDGGAKNIIEVGNAICTKYGVTAVLSSDGSIVLSGKAEKATGNFLIANDIKTGSQSASYASLIPIKSGIYKSGIYTASGLSDDRVILQVLNYNSSSDVDTFESDVFTTTKQYIDFRLMLKRTADFTTPLTIYPMCCTKAEWDISHAYQPYRPSYQELYEMVKALQAQLNQ